MQYRPVPRSRAPRQNKRWKRVAVIVAAGVVGVFVLANLAVGLVYAGKTYPGVKVAGKQFGSVGFADISGRLDNLELLPASVELKYKQKKDTATPAELGIAVDKARLAPAVKQRHWLPVWNLMSPSDTPLTLKVDDKKLDERLAAVGAAHKETPVDARITQKTDGFALTAGVKGSALDAGGSHDAVLAIVRNGRDTVSLIVKPVEPAVTDASLDEPLKKLQAAVATPVSYSYGGKKSTATPTEITGWYRPSAEAGSGGYALSEPVLKSYISTAGKQAGIWTANMAAAVTATRDALDTGKALSFALVAGKQPAAKTYRYCTAVRGVDASKLPELQQKLLSTYADERGWGLKGSVDYVYATSGCDFTVWLAAASQMPTFGAICDSLWSCMVSPNVVINYDRWLGASDAWNAAGGYLNDYRSMVINHETGHWLGFYHKYCGGAGQQAPVMQQQSIDLQGCVFNPWPMASEQAALKGKLGI